jgi:2-(1,2-epoxy-1,2-dihydrophenyl)acetyl-CoA isomerase
MNRSTDGCSSWWAGGWSSSTRARDGRVEAMTDGLRVEVDGAVATLTLDRPTALNALTVPVKDALREALESIATDRAVRAVILTGAGRAFCAGQDLAEREQPDAAPLEIEVRERYNPIIRALRSMGQPVIAAVNGVAAGAGASLAFACDLRIAAEEARFIPAFGRIGLVPDSGATWFLPRIVGWAKANELALLNDPVDAAQALRLGLVSRVVPGDQLIPEAHALADRLADGPPLALALTKGALERSLSIGLDEALEGEAKLQGIAGASADHAEGLAAFREKRPPRFTGE